MRPRQEITDLFSSFVQFEADRFQQWAIDARLRRNMQTCLNQVADVAAARANSEQFWVLSWYRHWQAQTMPLAQQHLSAYLQEPCYWAAQETSRKFANLPHRLSDYFQTAIAEINAILTGFNPERGASLAVYAKIAFLSRLRDILRQRRETDGVTTWTLLRSRVGKQGLLSALQQAGLSAAEVEQYWLAWVCFKALYKPTQTGMKRLPEPDRALWEAIAHLYNQERRSQLATPGAACNPDTIAQWLQKAATHVRTYLYPPITSFAPTTEEPEVDRPDPQTESVLAAMIAEEDLHDRLQQQQQVFDLLTATVAQMPAEMQAVLRLYYQQHQTQQQIAARLGMSQPTVVRRLVKARDTLLAALVQWSRDVLNIPPTPDLVKDRGQALEEWLRLRFGQQPSVTRGNKGE